MSGNEEMPDAMELVYQSALVLGKYGAVSIYFSLSQKKKLKKIAMAKFYTKRSPTCVEEP